MKKSSLFESIASVILILYGLMGKVNQESLIFDSVLLLLFSLFFIFKAKDNVVILPTVVFIGYCIYSIVIGEFLVGGELSVPMSQVKTIPIYGLTLKILTIFIGLIVINFKRTSGNTLRIIPKNNSIIFGITITLLLIIGIFGVDRAYSSSYTVNITPVYEYSGLLFLFAYYYSGDLKRRKLSLFFLYGLFIIQDFYYGGRITSLQLMLMMALTLFRDKLSTKNTFFAAFVGIFLNSIVGAYRLSYSLDGVDIILITSNLLKNLFVFDTPPYAFYASATHVSAIEIANLDVSTRYHSLMEFAKSIFFGSGDATGNVTSFVSENFFRNIGGGIFPTHLYFWLGWIGVIISAFFVLYLFNGVSKYKNDYLKICFLVFLATAPRWFLYNPLNLFRPIVFASILYTSFYIFNQLLILIVRGRKSKIKPFSTIKKI